MTYAYCFTCCCLVSYTEGSKGTIGECGHEVKLVKCLVCLDLGEVDTKAGEIPCHRRCKKVLDEESETMRRYSKVYPVFELIEHEA